VLSGWDDKAPSICVLKFPDFLLSCVFFGTTAMPIRFQCETCDARMKVPEGSTGLRVKCPRCGQMQSVPSASEPVAVSVAAQTPGRRLSKRERKVARKRMMQTAMASAGGSDESGTPLVFRSTAEAGTLAGGLERVSAAGRYPKFAKRGTRPWFRRDRHAKSDTANQSYASAARTGQGVARPSGGPLSRLGQSAWQAGRSYALLGWLSWALRITAGLLIPGAVKVMLVVFDATGSPVVAALALVTGAAICAMLLTVGEIACATRDMARSTATS
jgi:phage FluMu protein Com